MLMEQIAPQMERSAGLASLCVGLRKGLTVPVDIGQSGSARVMLPRSGTGGYPEAVFLNTSGGLAAGDRLTYGLTLDAGTNLTASTQTAERAYLARGAAAVVRVTATVGAGARLVWLPQETILFEDCHLDRETAIDMVPGATCLLTETIVLGRRAMGENPRRARLSDRRMIRVAGRPLWAEALRLDADVLADAASPALLSGGAAFGVLVLAGPGAEAAAGPLAAAPAPDGVQIAVSGWNGRTVVRLVATDLWPLKTCLGRLVALMTGRTMPRTWQLQGATT